MAKRAFQAVVLFFAICGFLFVPLGKRTAIEHLQAIAGTPAAQQAASELKSGIVRLFDRLRSRAGKSADSSSEASDADTLPEVQRKPRSLAPPRERRKERSAERAVPETAARAPLTTVPDSRHSEPSKR
jgi:hypothetical protein